MSKKRVLIVYRSYFPSLSHLGPATAIRNLVNNLSDHYQFHILTLNHDFATGQPLFPDPVHVERNGPLTIEYVPRGIRALRILLQRMRQSFDVVDIQCAFDPLLAIPALVLHRLGFARHSRVCHTPHGIFMDVIMSAGPTKKALFCRMADMLGLYNNVTHLAGSPGEEVDIRRRHRREQTVLSVSQFVENTRDHRISRQKQPGDLRIAFVGRITQQKNFLFAIEVLRRLDIPSSLDVYGEVGDDPYAQDCMKEVQAGAGNCQINMKGNVDKRELFQNLANYDVLFHPTLGENFGHSIVEALSLGIPVLISDKSPWIDVESLQAGWSIPLTRPDLFAEKLTSISSMDNTAWSMLNLGALNYFSVTFDHDRTVKRYLQAYG